MTWPLTTPSARPPLVTPRQERAAHHLRGEGQSMRVAQEDLAAVPVASPLVSSEAGRVLTSPVPSGFLTKSGAASALRASSLKPSVLEPGESAVSSTTVLGTAECSGVARSSVSVLVSGTMVTSSGAASTTRFSKASVPGTSPYDGFSSTFSTLVMGIGDVGPALAADCASEKWSSESDDAGQMRTRRHGLRSPPGRGHRGRHRAHRGKLTMVERSGVAVARGLGGDQAVGFALFGHLDNVPTGSCWNGRCPRVAVSPLAAGARGIGL